jgi:hypothetical protein
MPYSKEKKKAYQKAYHQKWYADPENAKAKKENAKKHREISLKRNLDYVLQYKLQHPCVKCVDYHPEYIEKHPACLHFHHCKGDKDDSISLMVRNHVSIEKLQAEMDKCIVVCGNCHARIHEEERLNGG